MQLFVKQARKTLVDPILARFDISSPEPSSSEEEADPEEIKRQQEREKIRHLKNRKIYGSFPASSTLSLKPQGTVGVFIRRDVDDETMEVDIDLGGDLDGGEEKTSSPLAPLTETKLGIRIRRPTIKKAQSQYLNGTGDTKEGATTTKNSHRSTKKNTSSMSVTSEPPLGPQTLPEDIALPENPLEDPNSKRKSKNPKPKPETYKQSWSVSEQNLLEQLLEEIPDGEKFRYTLLLSLYPSRHDC